MYAAKEGEKMEILEFITKQLKNRYHITRIRCCNENLKEVELVIVYYDRKDSLEQIVRRIRKCQCRYSTVIVYDKDDDRLDDVIGAFQKNGLDLICIKEDTFCSSFFTRLDFERLW